MLRTQEKDSLGSTTKASCFSLTPLHHADVSSDFCHLAGHFCMRGHINQCLKFPCGGPLMLIDVSWKRSIEPACKQPCCQCVCVSSFLQQLCANQSLLLLLLRLLHFFMLAFHQVWHMGKTITHGPHIPQTQNSKSLLLCCCCCGFSSTISLRRCNCAQSNQQQFKKLHNVAKTINKAFLSCPTDSHAMGRPVCRESDWLLDCFIIIQQGHITGISLCMA